MAEQPNSGAVERIDPASEIACEFGNEVRKLEWFPVIDGNQLHEMYGLLQGIADDVIQSLTPTAPVKEGSAAAVPQVPGRHPGT